MTIDPEFSELIAALQSARSNLAAAEQAMANTVYRRFASLIQNVASQASCILSNNDAEDEILADVAYKLVKDASTEGIANVEDWIRAETCKAATAYHQKEKANYYRMAVDEPRQAILVLIQQCPQVVLERLDACTRTQRRVLELAANGRSLPQVAQELEKKISTVETHFHDGLNRIKATFYKSSTA